MPGALPIRISPARHPSTSSFSSSPVATVIAFLFFIAAVAWGVWVIVHPSTSKRFNPRELLSTGDGHDWLKLSSEERMILAQRCAAVRPATHSAKVFHDFINGFYKSDDFRDWKISEVAARCAVLSTQDLRDLADLAESVSK